ncbi:MAG: xylanase, partial [Verrucomicrobiaceae bacterium]|nr:xylanase [Verrucomicrobiaceae bacterium]
MEGKAEVPGQHGQRLRKATALVFRMKFFALASLIAASTSLAAEPLLTLKLWPEGPPGQMIIKPAPKDGKAPNPNVITNITEPTITIYKPEKPNGTAVVVAPGGGFRFLSIKHEGTAVCEWLNILGVTGVLLTYRTPTNEEPTSYEKPVQDAQRAIGMVRHHAAEWGIDPKRVGLLGFSAGGNLAGHTSFDRI